MLQPRDMDVLREVGRWRFLLSRHIRVLAGFPSQRTADRRLHALIAAGYLQRHMVLYGVPALYQLTHKGRMLTGFGKRAEKIRLEQIPHDICVLDVLIFLQAHYAFPFSKVTAEKELHRKDGFGTRKHYPDFLFEMKGKACAVEVELSLKSADRLAKNAQINFLNYDVQFWVISKDSKALKSRLEALRKSYSDIYILYLEDMKTVPLKPASI